MQDMTFVVAEPPMNITAVAVSVEELSLAWERPGCAKLLRGYVSSYLIAFCVADVDGECLGKARYYQTSLLFVCSYMFC